VLDWYFKHLYQPPPGADRRTLLLLHGTGGDEHELLPLALALQPTAGVLSLRAPIDDGGVLRFSRRLPAGVYDLGDLERRAAQLATFIAQAAAQYRFDSRQVVALALSEGANIASTLLLVSPETLAGAVLFRGTAPMMPRAMRKVPGTPVLLSNGLHDPVVQPEDTEEAVAILRVAGADVTVRLQPAAQQLVQADVDQAREWFTSCGPLRSPLRMS
jgi:predicted esterase